MKVGTDGVLLGAWAGNSLETCQYILDIGTGTGLIAMMLAQRFNNIFVEAIDINATAVALASLNFEKCPWSKRLSVFHSTLEAFETEKTYDVIVSNPPYFTKSGISDNMNRHFARDIENLSWKQILIFAKEKLNDNGRIEVIYPFELLDEMLNQAKDLGFFLIKITEVIPKPGRSAKRVLLSFANSIDGDITKNQLIIENEDRHDYHEDYKSLCREFYLKF